MTRGPLPRTGSGYLGLAEATRLRIPGRRLSRVIRTRVSDLSACLILLYRVKKRQNSFCRRRFALAATPSI
jgi:hypothetical protein